MHLRGELKSLAFGLLKNSYVLAIYGEYTVKNMNEIFFFYI